MADIHQIITLGIGTPADIPHFLLVGLSVNDTVSAGSADTVIRCGGDDVVIRAWPDDRVVRVQR